MRRLTMPAKISVALAAVFAFATLPALAEVQTKMVEYKDGDTTLKGYLAWDDAVEGKRPGVLVVHEWWGLNDYARSRADQLAELGYVAFALDMYGGDKVTDHPKQAGEWMREITANTQAWQARAQQGLEVLKQQEEVDADHVAAIGYCFGGSTVMQMAYAGADVDAVVSFHGSLPAAPEGVGEVGPRVLVAHGRDDAFIKPEQVQAFKEGLDKAGAEWEFIEYSGARHAFTNPNAASYGVDNIQYDKKADERSWAAMITLFDDIFTQE